MNLKFDKTKEYSDTQLDEIAMMARGILNDICNYRISKEQKVLDTVPNLEKKYIKWERDGTIHYMYVTHQGYDKWGNDITLQGVEFSYDKSEYRDNAFFSYDPMHNCFFGYNDFRDECEMGLFIEIDKEEFEKVLKEATEWTFKDALECIKYV